MERVARVVDAIASGVERAERELRAEQAVRGLDMLDELQLHTVVARSLEASGRGVLREAPYPTPPSRTARRSERDRCDFVLTPRPGQRLRDAVELARLEDERRATLFAEAGADAADDDCAADPCDAIWIEFKTTGQFTCRDGVGGPNLSYGSELIRGLGLDIRKLGSDPVIVDGVAVVALFATDERVARHDLAEAAHRMLNAGVRFVAIEVAAVRIANRIGNSVCAIAGFGTAPAFIA